MSNSNNRSPVVLKQLFDEARLGLHDGSLKEQTLAFLRHLEGVVRARPELAQLLHTLSGLHMSVPRLAALSKAMYENSAMQPQAEYTGSRLHRLPDDLHGLIYEHVSAANVARSKTVNKASKKKMDEYLPARLADNASARDTIISSVYTRVTSLTETEDNGRFNGDHDRRWEYIANAQADVVIGMLKSGLDADSIFQTFDRLDDFYLHLASPTKVNEVLKKVVIPIIPKLKRVNGEDKLSVIGFLAAWILIKMMDKWAADPIFLTTCKYVHTAVVALANTLTRDDIDRYLDENRRRGLARVLADSWAELRGSSITEKTVAGYFRSIYEAVWRVAARVGSDEVIKQLRNDALHVASRDGVEDKVRAWMNAHTTPRANKSRR